MSAIELYYENAALYAFSARVTAVWKTECGFAVTLDRTAFFPEGGGQPGDRGEIGGVAVTDTRRENGEILHIIAGEPAFSPGDPVECALDRPLRFARMQAHSGEHIVSGLAFSTYGANNVGFHMDESLLMTVDFDRPLDQTALRALEARANAVVYENRRVRAWFPTAAEAADLRYRSKLTDIDRLRLVEIEGCDVCACCAPHVSRTGEIGLIKVLSAASHRGGVRITLLCGSAALEDYALLHAQAKDVGAQLKVPSREIAGGVARLREKCEEQSRSLTAMRVEALRRYAESMRPTREDVVLFVEDAAPDALRRLADACKRKCEGVFAVFSGEDGRGYSFAAASRAVDLGSLARGIAASFGGKAGGRGEMIQGFIPADRAAIEARFLRILRDPAKGEN